MKMKKTTLLANVTTVTADNQIKEDWLESSNFALKKDFKASLEEQGYTVLDVYSEKQYKMY